MLNRIGLRVVLLNISIIFLSGFTKAQSPGDWKNIQTIEDVCVSYPERISALLAQFDLDAMGLAEAKIAIENKDIIAASTHVLNYYKKGTSAQYMRIELPPESNRKSLLGDSLLQNTFTFYSEVGTVPNLSDGRLDWSYEGPSQDIEWAWALNRHYPAKAIFDVYLDTGNPTYAKYLDAFIKDWIVSSLPYPGVKSRTAMWRGLEVSYRLKIWAQIFYAFINTDYLSPATQLLILSSLPEHAHYARNFHGQNNWLTMEMSGLATVATAWKEFKKADEWLEYSKNTMTMSMKDQVYPDGVQTELTSSYHYVSLANFVLFDQICKNANEPLPLYFRKTIQDMYDYLAYTMRPDGYGILNNDADRRDNRAWVSEVIDKYARADWKYIATNGKEGIKPEGLPSKVYPWAGQMISRSGYNTDAHWTFFDIGPWGSGHQHNDKLHLSISAYGRDLLVDAGRFAYRGEIAKKFRTYARGSQGHNVILIDGNGQSPGPKVVEEPLIENQFKITNDFDYAWASFDKFLDTKGEVKHTRAMMYLRDNFWIVVDDIVTDQPRNLQTLWHWHPSITEPKKMYGAMATLNDRGNLRILPVGKQKWKVENVKGQEKPEIQGWYSKEYNKYEPNWTTIYSTDIKSSQTFVWVLYPSEGFDISIKAKIIDQDKDVVTLKITDFEKQEWIVTVPYRNSDLAASKEVSRLGN